MSRDEKCAALSKMNNKFTEEMLIGILSKTYNGKKMQVTDWNFNEGSAKGNNYLSNVYKGRVNGTTDDNPKQYVQANIVVKSMPNNPGTRKTLRCADFFRNEIAFYTQVRSQIHLYSFFLNACKKKIFSCVFRCVSRKEFVLYYSLM